MSADTDLFAEALVVAYLADHPGATAVDMLLAHVLPDAGGTLWYLPVLRRLVDNGTIERAKKPSLYEEHVSDFPGAHLPGTSLCVEQGVRWRLTGR